MIKINKEYKHLFIKTRYGYLYPVEKGVYLSFDKDKSYIGIEYFYLPHDFKKIEKNCDIKLQELLSKNILEDIDYE